MTISQSTLKEFAKAVTPPKQKSEGTMVTGTAKEYDGGIYVQIDGSEQLTPIASSTAGIKDGDRITVMVKDHKVTATGNVSMPSTNQGDLDDLHSDISGEFNNKIGEFEEVIASKATIEELEAQTARIDTLTADNVTIKETLTAETARINNLEANKANIEDLEAMNAHISNLEADMLTAEVADITYAKIDDLEAVSGDFYTLQADYADFKTVTADDISANTAKIEHLESTMITSDNLDAKYANIDFANIGEAAIEKLFSESGIIGDLVMSDGHVTGTLVGVTIKGDLIEGGTVVADKLVIKGEDGLFYKLNTDGVDISAEQTEYNSLNGSVITAKSITAEKVNVDDLVAFGATIGGFNIDTDSLYSGVKSSVDNTTPGVYMDDTGQFSLGNATDYLKFYKDGSNWKLDISASSIKFGSSSTSLEQTITNIQNAAEAAEEAASNANSNASDAAEKADQLEQSLNDYKDVVAGSYATKAELESSGNSILATVEENYQIKGDYVTDEESALVLEADGGVVQIGENAGLPPEGVTVYGQTRQNLWVIPSGTSNGVTVTANANGSVTVDGTATGVASPYVQTYVLRPGSTCTVSVDKVVQSSNDASKGCFFIEMRDSDSVLSTKYAGFGTTTATTFVVPDATMFARFGFYCASGNTVSGTYRVMLNEGSELQPWCPPGLNSMSAVHAGIGVPATGYDTPNQCGVVAEVDDPGYIVPGDKYSISFLVTRGNVYLNEYRFTTTSRYGVGFHVIEATAKDIGEGASHPGCLLKATYVGGACVGPVSIRRASEGRSSTAISLLGNELRSLPDGTRDELHIDAGGNVVLTKRVGYANIPTDAADVVWDDAYSRIFFFFPDNSLMATTEAAKLLRCDKVPPRLSTQNSFSGTYVVTTTSAAAYIRVDGATSAADVISKVGGGQILYPLETVKTIPLGKIDLPALNASGANVWVVASDSFGNTYTMEPDIHVSWYGKNANVLGRFASKAELEVTADSIRSEVAEEYLSLESAEDTYAKKSLVTQTADAIRSEVSATYQTKAGMKDYATTSSVTQTADAIRSEVSTQIENIEVGGRNLLYDTKGMTVKMSSGNAQRVYTTYASAVGNGGGLVRTADGIKLTFGSKTKVSIQAPLASFGNVENNETVTLSFTYRGNITSFGNWYFLQQTTPNVSLYGFPSLNGDGQWHEYIHTFSSSSANVRTCVSVLLFYNLAYYDNTKWVEIKEGTLKLERGNKATDWSPAPEDMLSTSDASATYATKTSLSTVEQTVNGLKSTVSSNYTTLNNKFSSYYTKTEVDQKDNSIKSTVSSVQTTANNALEKASTVEQTADGLEVRLTQAEKDVDAAQTTANAAKKQVWHTATGTSGTAGYIGIATIKIESPYANAPLYFEFTSRSRKATPVWIRFNSVNSVDPTLNSITADGDANVYIRKTTTSTWQVIVQKSEPYDQVSVTDFNNGGNYMNGKVTVTWTNTMLTSLPSGCTKATVLAGKRNSSDIDNAAKTATNYLKFDSSGLCVGNMTASTLSYNTLITSTGLHIRNGTEDLASFEVGTIDLGGIPIEDAGTQGVLNSKITFAGGSLDSKTYITSGGRTETQLTLRESRGLSDLLLTADNATLSGNSVTLVAQTGQIILSPVIGGVYKKSTSYEMFAARRLYYNSSGTTGNVTLSESAANFYFLDIFFMNNDNYRDYVRVYAPNGNSAVLSNAVYKNEYTTTYVRNKVVTISGTSISVVSKRNGEAQVGQNNSCYATDATSVIKIYAVWGWK